jgi:hypothetical protein
MVLTRSIPKLRASLKLLPAHTGGEVRDGANPADYPYYMTQSQLDAADATALQEKTGNNAVSANETLTPSGPLSAADSGSGGPDECTYSIMEDTAVGRYWASSCSTAAQTAVAQVQATGGPSETLPNVRQVINSIMGSSDTDIFNKQGSCGAARWVGPKGQHQ